MLLKASFGLGRLAAAAFLTLSLLHDCCPAHARKVVIIRHGEKPRVGNDLSDAGRARAECIKNEFSQGDLRPSYIFAQQPDRHPDGFHEIRSLKTCQPLADHLGLPAVTKNPSRVAALSRNVDLSVKRDDVTDLVKAVQAVPPSGSSPVLICWAHDAIPHIAAAFGVQSPPSWRGRDYDSVWVVDTDARTMTVQSQNCVVSRESRATNTVATQASLVATVAAATGIAIA